MRSKWSQESRQAPNSCHGRTRSLDGRSPPFLRASQGAAWRDTPNRRKTTRATKRSFDACARNLLRDRFLPVLAEQVIHCLDQQQLSRALLLDGQDAELLMRLLVDKGGNRSSPAPPRPSATRS